MKRVLSLILVTVMIAVMIPIVSVAAPDPDTPFYNYIDGDSEFKQLIGWWLHPAQWDELRTIDINFSSPNAFNGFVMTLQAATFNVRIQLLDSHYNVKEEVLQEIHEGVNNVSFSNAYPANVNYCLRFTWEGTDPNQHFVIRAAESTGLVNYTVTGGVNNSAGQFTNPAPAISLKGAEYTGPAIVVSGDQWLCDPTAAVSIGYGITSDLVNNETQHIDINFSTLQAFGGFAGYFYVASSVADISLLDRAGNVLYTIPSYSFASGDTWYQFNFNRAYGPGDYTIRVTFVSAIPHLILGQVPAGSAGDLTTFTLTGAMVLNQGGLPCIKLIGDVNPSTQQALFSGTVDAGWWFHNIPGDLEGGAHINVTFTADQWFNRMKIGAYGAGAVNMELRAENGNVVDNIVFACMYGEGENTFVTFNRMHAPGRYVLSITPNNIPNGVQSPYFLLGKGSTESDNRVRVDANVYEAGRHIAPAITLFGDEQPTFELTKINASLTDGNMISLNFKADNALFLDSDDGSSIVTFTVDGVSTDIEGVVSGTDRIFTLPGLSPEEITKTVTAVLKTEIGGVAMTASAVNFVPKTYFQNLETNGTPNLQSLAAATLNYAAAAQAYKGETVTIAVGDAAHLPATRAFTDSQNIVAIAAANKKASWKAVGLKLEDEVMLRYTFTIDNTVDPDDVTIKFSYDSAVQKTLTIADCTDAGSGRYVCYVPMPANKLSTVVSAVIYENDTAISSTFNYSVESYAAAKANGGDALADIVVAMMQYGDAAVAYVANPNS